MQEPLRSVTPIGSDHNPPNSPPKPERAKAQPRSERPLPTDRMKFAIQVETLKAYVSASGQGRHAISTDDLDGHVSVTPSTAGLNNAFFHSSGLLAKESRGRYLPIPEVVAFAREAGFDSAEAAKLLGPVLAKTWYYEATRNRIELEAASRQQVIQCLARAAGAQGHHIAQLDTIIDWLAFVGLVTVEGDTVRLAEAAGPATADTDTTAPEPEEVTETPTSAPARQRGAAVLSFSLELTADDLAKISAEQITALFTAVGQVMAAKNAAD